MLKKALPRSFRAFLRSKLRPLLKPGPPLRVTPATPAPCPRDEAAGLPIPPRDLWLSYGGTPEEHLACGRKDVAAMREIAAQCGAPLESAGRILEMGCGSGRMLRWLHDLAAGREIWGVDLLAPHVRWCKQHLRPPFHFAVTTPQPHLPFEDRYFDYVYAGSVFTHIDDLADAWVQELRRVIRPGGRLYVTIHDKKTMEILERGDGYWLAAHLRSLPEYARACRSDFGALTVGSGDWGDVFVFYDAEYFCRGVEPFFRVLTVRQEAYAYQTAVLMERR